MFRVFKFRVFESTVLFTALLVALAAVNAPFAYSDEHPLSVEQRDKLTSKFRADIAQLNERIAAEPKKVDLYSRRADAYFFLADFDKALADYEHMVTLDADLDASHWRRGIARFYAGKYPQAANQFEIYNSFDDVDRENGIWRYFSQFKAHGEKKAKEGLLKYRKDDREPFPSVYKLFSGDMTGAEILKNIDSATLSSDEREKRLFYANLYIGLNDALEGRNESAIKQLKLATANKWGPTAGYGPNYMWHVGRIHYDRLTATATTKTVPKE